MECCVDQPQEYPQQKQRECGSYDTLYEVPGQVLVARQERDNGRDGGQYGEIAQRFVTIPQPRNTAQVGQQKKQGSRNQENHRSPADYIGL